VNQVHLSDEEATLQFGRKLAAATFLDPAQSDAEPAPGSAVGIPSIGGVIHLHGDLGAGKTTLARGIMRGFGYTGAVKSPTYTLVEPYEFERCHIYHFDLYRLADPEEVEYLGVEDYFSDNNLCIIEWAEKGSNIIPAADLDIELETEGTGRLLRCRSNSSKGLLIAKRLWPSGRS
jgi:tRNA threonylcarbamoyladenosine biosynthesis protein TsaE